MLNPLLLLEKSLLLFKVIRLFFSNVVNFKLLLLLSLCFIHFNYRVRFLDTFIFHLWTFLHAIAVDNFQTLLLSWNISWGNKDWSRTNLCAPLYCDWSWLSFGSLNYSNRLLCDLRRAVNKQWVPRVFVASLSVPPGTHSQVSLILLLSLTGGVGGHLGLTPLIPASI